MVSSNHSDSYGHKVMSWVADLDRRRCKTPHLLKLLLSDLRIKYQSHALVPNSVSKCVYCRIGCFVDAVYGNYCCSCHVSETWDVKELKALRYNDWSYLQF